MSGFEIAGIVLATIPLFIATAENYRNGLGALGRLRNKERILQQYTVDLKAQVTLLEALLKGFLAEIDVDFDTKRALLKDPSAYTSPIVRAKMTERWGGQRPYENMVEQVNRMRDALSAQLKGDMTLAQFQYLVQRQQTRAEAMSRVEFSWKRPERNETLQTIRDCNDWLFKLQQALKTAEPFNRQLLADEQAALFDVYPSAKQLYDVLSQYCTCNCTVAHEARLCLKISYRNVATQDEAYFEALIFRNPQTPCEAAIRVANCSPGPYNYVRDVCQTLGDAHHNREQIELRIDQQLRLWECARHNARLAADLEDVTLETMLGVAATSQYAQAFWLKKQKALLALKLAHSLPQLRESAWSRQYWSLRCILFMRERVAQQPLVNLAQPYVSTRLCPPGLQQTPGAVNNHPANMQSEMHTGDHPVPSLLALGVVLLELLLNGPITACINNTALPLRFAAVRAMEKCKEDGMLTLYYQRAIEACLILARLPGTTTSRSFEDFSFRAWYYQNVIAPLTDHIVDKFYISYDELATI